MEPTPLIVSVAPNGARRMKHDHAGLPMTAAELADTAVACADAGAALFHAHARDENGRHSLDPALYQATVDAVRKAVGDRLIVQATTEAAGIYDPPAQRALIEAIEVESISLAPVEVMPDEAAVAPAARVIERAARRGVLLQYIVYSIEQLRRCVALWQRGVLPAERPAVLIVLGQYHKRPATVDDLAPYLDEGLGRLHWGACAFGPDEHACVMAAAGQGGHLRVGFENNLDLIDGTQAPDNAALVAQVSDAADSLGRPLADAAEARRLLALARGIAATSRAARRHR